MGAVGTDTEYVLQSPLTIIVKTCLIECVLQSEAAEFAVGPVRHETVTTGVVRARHKRRI